MADEKKAAGGKRTSKPGIGDAEPLEGEATEKKTSVPESSRRPARTIELEAEEVKQEPETTSAEPEEKTQTEETPSPEAKGKKQASASGTTRRKTQASGRRTAQEPPQRTQPGEIRGFVTHLAAGLVGGLIGVVAAGIGLDKLQFGQGSGSAETPGNQTAVAPAELEEIRRNAVDLDNRVRELDNKLASRKSSGPGSGEETRALKESLATLEKRLARSEQTLAAGKDFPTAMNERVAKIESTLKALGEAAEKGGDVSQTAAISNQIGEAEKRLELRIGAFEKRLDALPPPAPSTDGDLKELRDGLSDLRDRLDTLSNTTDTVKPEALTPLTERLSVLEKSVSALTSGDGSRSASSAAALAIAFSTLRDAVTSGEPYAKELTLFRKLAASDLDVSVLERHAATGVATPQLLEKDFGRYARKARTVMATPKDDGSLLGQFISSARSVVKVRRLESPENGGSDDPLQRISAKVSSGDLKGALADIAQLPEAARTALGPWTTLVQARVAVTAALGTISAQLAELAMK